MIRILTATAVAVLLAAPAYAQYSSDQGMSSPSQSQSGSLDSGGTVQRTPDVGQVPSDCLPNDPRIECESALSDPSLDQQGQQLGQTPNETTEDEVGRTEDESISPSTPNSLGSGSDSAPASPQSDGSSQTGSGGSSR